jgi:VanZ family protein
MISFLLSVRQSVRFVLIILYVGCIAALSLLPPKDLPQIQLFEGADKVIHFMMYLGFSLLGCWNLRTELKPFRIIIIILVSISWGILMELMQLEMHIGRSLEWYDILANSMGVLFGTLCYQLIVNKFAQSND